MKPCAHSWEVTCVGSSSCTEDLSFVLAMESPCAPFQLAPIASSFRQTGPNITQNNLQGIIAPWRGLGV